MSYPEEEVNNGINPGNINKTAAGTTSALNNPDPPSEDPEYTNSPKAEQNAETVDSTADENAPNREKPTTASTEKQKDLPTVMSQCDPQGASVIAPMMYPMLEQIKMAAGASGNSSSGQANTPKGSVKKIIEEALTGALNLLSNKYSVDKIAETFNRVLENNGIQNIEKEYRQIVKNALANLLLNYNEYGEGNLPESEYEEVTEIGLTPSPLVLESQVPDLYVQQYYSKSLDPYPGYIKWVLPQTDDEAEEIAVYTERSIGDPYYVTASQEIFAKAEIELAEGLEPYIIDLNLTAEVLNELLSEQNNNIEKNKKEKSSGKNSSLNSLASLISLAGYAGQMSNKQTTTQQPPSVLNQSSCQQSQEKFMENIGKIREMKKKAREAVKPKQSENQLNQQPSSSSSPNIPALFFSLKGGTS